MFLSRGSVEHFCTKMGIFNLTAHLHGSFISLKCFVNSMDLGEITYNYDISSQKFLDISFEFMVPKQKEPEDVPGLFRAYLQDLKGILDEEFAQEGVEKKESGIMAKFLTKGEYKFTRKEKPVEGKAWLEYETKQPEFQVSLAFSVKHGYNRIQEGSSIVLSHKDTNADRLLRIYDRVCSLPSLNPNIRSKNIMQRIAKLRA